MKKYLTIITTALVLFTFFSMTHYDNSGNHVVHQAIKQYHDDPNY